MKRLSVIGIIVSVFVLPCVLDAQKLLNCVIILASLVASFLFAKKFNPQIFVR